MRWVRKIPFYRWEISAGKEVGGDALRGPALRLASPICTHAVRHKPKETKRSPVRVAQIGVGVREKLHPILSPPSHLPGQNNRHHPGRDSRTSGCVCISRMTASISHGNTTCGDVDLTLGIIGSTDPSDALAAGTGLSYPSKRGSQTPVQLHGQTPRGGWMPRPNIIQTQTLLQVSKGKQKAER